MKSFFKIIFPILILSISFFSCTKNVEERIEGEWSMINLDNPYDAKEEWHFNGQNIYFVDAHTGRTCGSCSYKIKTSPFRKKILLDNMNYPQTQYEILTEFVIKKLNSKTLILLNDEQGGLLTLEFTKK